MSEKVTREMSLNLFLARADEVISGKYLLAVKKIDDMLKVVPTSRILFEVFEYCCKEDYQSLKQTYFRLEGNKGGFTCPEDPRHIIALGCYVLSDIKNGDIKNFNDFLLTYFPAGDNLMASYTVFINTLVVPFRNAVKTVVESVIVAKNISETRTPQPIKNADAIDNKYLEGLVSLIEDDIRLIESSGRKEKDRAVRDAATILGAFFTEAAKGNVSMLAPMFLGYKYAAAKVRRPKLHADEIEEMLVDHGILKSE